MKTIKEPNYFIFNPISNDNYPSLFNIPKMPEFIHNKPNLINNKFHFSPYFLNLINFPFFIIIIITRILLNFLNQML